MTLEDRVFAQKQVLFERLPSYGFTFDGENYRYSEAFLDGAFEAQILVSKAGQVSGRVLDLDLEEEYLALRIKGASGSFVGQVREAYLEVLNRIAESCFEAQPFVKEQTNRLAKYLAETFGDLTDHPFSKFPNFTAFRHPDNQKWYGLIGLIERSKLQLGEEVSSEEELKEEVEIINVKVKADLIPSLVEKVSVYPAYHMSKNLG